MITGFEKMSVRFFFIEDFDEIERDGTECTEEEFLAATGEIEYQRHTVFENGVSQICLTKNPLGSG